MQAPSRLAHSICSARRSRVFLLAGAVAMSVVLVTSIACVMSSLNAAFRAQIDTQIGTAEARLLPVSGETFGNELLDEVSEWKGVERAVPRLQQTLSLVILHQEIKEQGDAYRTESQRYAVNAFVNGIDPSVEFDARPIELVEGRYPQTLDEIVIDMRVAQRLSWTYVQQTRSGNGVDLFADPSAYLDLTPLEPGERVSDSQAMKTRNASIGPRIGDTLTVPRLFGKARTLTIVGLAKPAPLGGKPIAYTTISTLDALAREKGRLSDIELKLSSDINPEEFVERHKEDLFPEALLQTTGRITSGVEQNMQASQLGFVLISVIALISAAFIITTGLTTGVAEQQRTLAVLRAIGAPRHQLAVAQLLVGTIVAGLGVILGLPVGIMVAYALTLVFDQQMAEGLVIPPVMLTLTVLGSVLAGLMGALWPAWRAASLSPLQAMSVRATPMSVRGIGLVSMAGCFGVLGMIAIVLLLADLGVFFYIYVSIGLPMMFIGYFLISVPLVVIVARLLSRPISAVFGLPTQLLGRTVRATPYRHGFTAGALMTGLALMIGIWTNGSAAMRDWLGKIEFPDAFAYGLPLSEEAQGILEELPLVDQTCAISMRAVRTDAFGVEGLSSYKTNFIAFEPEPFLNMARLEFVQGDQETAVRQLNEGGAVIVAREFLVARGLGVGDTFKCTDSDGTEHSFKIVGVVTSPGLELVSQYFDLGDNFVNQAIGSVFGSRQDMIDRFGMRTAQLIQIDLNDGIVAEIGDEQAIAEIRQSLLGAGVLNVGSGRIIRRQIEAVFTSTLVVFSTVAIGAMLVACFGVANLIIAEINARRYEMGVLRAVGASKGQLVRLITAQALIIALTACVLGTGLGIQAAWGGREMNRRVIGIDLDSAIPLDAIAIAWGAAITLSLLAAAPSAMRLGRSQIRNLLISSG
ncbi:MAG: ABC transporter permease [Phycisphaerales bacterium]